MITSVEVASSEAMLALTLSTLFVKCLMKRLRRSVLGQIVDNILGGCLFDSILTIWCSYLFYFFTLPYKLHLMSSFIPCIRVW